MTTKGVMELRMETGLVALNLLMNSVGSQDNLPADILNNKGRNVYFFTVSFKIGLMYPRYQEYEKFYVLLVLFLFTGFALKIYLNERPFEPRERDYALVGSFMCLQSGLVLVYSLYKVLKYIAKFAAPLIITASLLAAPF
jgi:hypothetical protein